MRRMIGAALAALPLATGAQAANLYSACYFSNSVTQLFVLEGDALAGNGVWSYDGTLDWESKFAKDDPAMVHHVSGYDEKSFVGQFSDHAQASGNRGSCWVTTSRDRALNWFHKQGRDRALDTARLRDWRPVKAGVVAVEDWSGRPSATPIAKRQTETVPAAPSSPRLEAAAPPAPEAPARPKKSNAQADAEYAAAMAEYERQMAAQRQQVEDYRRAQVELARKKEEQRLAVERKMSAFQRVLAEHEQRQRAYEASEARHRKCVSGDQQACADIGAGKPVLADQQLAQLAPASTSSDPNRCVTTAEVRENATFQGNTSASVRNGCGEKVDVRICLKRASDWNCGVDLAVDPQEQAVHSSFNATGELFIDARITGSSKPFADPPAM